MITFQVSDEQYKPAGRQQHGYASRWDDAVKAAEANPGQWIELEFDGEDATNEGIKRVREQVRNRAKKLFDRGVSFAHVLDNEPAGVVLPFQLRDLLPAGRGANKR